MELKQYPRPPQDNGRGIHFGLDVRPALLEHHLPLIADLGMKWVVFYVGDEIQAGECAKQAWARGIMPIIRLNALINGALRDWGAVTRALVSQGIPAYIQIFNEPGDSREWRGGNVPANYTDIFAERWNSAAMAVVEAGGLPGLQSLEKIEIECALSNTDSRVLDRMWFASHAYASNHPPNYPYDIGKTVFEDDTCCLRWLEEAAWLRGKAGFVTPIIVAEGGYWYQQQEDNHYPRIDDNLHAKYNVEVFEWFLGKLSNGEPLPDYLFAFCPWIWSSPDWSSWYLGIDGTRQQTLDAVKAIKPFVRKFSWEQHGQPVGIVEESIRQEARKYKWMPINTGAALYIFAQVNNLGYPQTDEFEYTISGVTYVVQVYNGGIVYVKKGDWSNCKWIKKSAYLV